MERLLIIFAKYPRPGQVKTRLAATIGDTKAAALYGQLIRHTLSVACSLNHLIYKAVAVARKEDVAPFRRRFPGADDYFAQSETPDLGLRMREALVWGAGLGSRKMVIIGTDCPWLDRRHLKKAFEALEESDVVFGPAEDGGYYLIGAKQVHPQLFSGIPWSTEAVLKTSLRRAQEAGLRYTCLESLRDLDEAEDLNRLQQTRPDLWRTLTLNGWKQLPENGGPEF